MRPGIMIPHGGLNGDLGVCISALCNQSVKPELIHVLVDSKNPSTVPRWLFSLCRNVGIRLNVEYDTDTTSIIDMRIKLLKRMKQWGLRQAVFVDDDMILHYEALNYLILAMEEKDGKNPPFVEGMRIEIGGRADGKEFNESERKLMASNNTDELQMVEQAYGDTALLLCDVDDFLSLSRADMDKLVSFYDKRGVGGSDFALTSLVARKCGPGFGCRSAFGWHTAAEQKGYWKNYAAADSIFDNVFGGGQK